LVAAALDRLRKVPAATIHHLAAFCLLVVAAAATAL
jgi:hypothetical protein